MRILYVVLALVPLLNGRPSLATDSEGYYDGWSLGNNSCGMFLSQSDNAFIMSNYTQWMSGVLDYVDRSMPNTYNIAGYSDGQGVFVWLKNYCSSHPTVTFSGAVSAFIEFAYPSRRQTR
jgi:hypothetical protein